MGKGSEMTSDELTRCILELMLGVIATVAIVCSLIPLLHLRADSILGNVILVGTLLLLSGSLSKAIEEFSKEQR